MRRNATLCPTMDVAATAGYLAACVRAYSRVTFGGRADN
jgi:hypothetical protein